MERGELLGDAFEQAVVSGVGGQLHRMPSDFAARPFVDFCAQRRGQQLRSEAYAEHRTIILSTLSMSRISYFRYGCSSAS